MLDRFQLLEQCKHKKVILDTGPLSLLLVGGYNTKLIANLDIENNKFTKEDFDILINFVKDLSKYTTPHILAETCNITENKIGKERWSDLLNKNFIFLRDGFLEIQIDKNDILSEKVVFKIGIADTGIYLKCEDLAVITIDWELRNRCRKKGGEAYHLDEITKIPQYTALA